MGSLLLSLDLSESWVYFMIWQAPPNDSTGFWDQYGRELPGLISVSLHISVGIHAEEELTHFLQISPTTVQTVDVCIYRYIQGGE